MAIAELIKQWEESSPEIFEKMLKECGLTKVNEEVK